MRREPVVLGDWGSTQLRLWLRGQGTTLAAYEAPGLLAASDAPVVVLRNAVEALGGRAVDVPILLSGMAGARAGLVEAGYVPCPGGAAEWIGAAVQTSLDRNVVHVLPGFSSRDGAGRPDVMRGEEAQVFGALAMNVESAQANTIVLPGTHSKWVTLEDGRIAGFTTCPTGELFARLRGSSLASDDGTGPIGPDADGFGAGIGRAREGGALMSSLFEARAAQLLDGRSSDWACAFLSGLLIGSEIAAMAHGPSSDAPALLVGSPDLVRLYAYAFEQFGLDCRTADGETCALKGLETAHAQLG